MSEKSFNNTFADCTWHASIANASDVLASCAVSSVGLSMHARLWESMHTFAHEAVRSLRTAWAARMTDTRKSAMTLVCCNATRCFTQVLTSHVTYC